MRGRHYYKYRHRGMTLIELAIVLGVTGLLVGGIWAAAAAAHEAQRVNQTVDQVRQIVENVRTRYATVAQFPNQNYAAFTLSAATADLMPAETRLNRAVIPANCTAVGANQCAFAHPWDNGDTNALCGDGSICLSANQVFGPVATIIPRFNFVVMLRNLPQNGCIKVGSSLINIASDIGMVALGTDVADNAAPSNVTLVPTVAWLTANCSGVALNHLYLEFRLAP